MTLASIDVSLIAPAFLAGLLVLATTASSARHHTISAPAGRSNIDDSTRPIA